MAAASRSHLSGNIQHPRLDYEDIDQTSTRRPYSRSHSSLKPLE
jgi:hypothetical protein